MLFGTMVCIQPFVQLVSISWGHGFVSQNDTSLHVGSTLCRGEKTDVLVMTALPCFMLNDIQYIIFALWFTCI